jgi:glutaredoxin-related protein
LSSFSVLAGKNTDTWYKPGNYPDSRHHFMFQSVEIKGAPNYYKFKSNLRKDQDVLDEFKNNDTTGIISYLLFEDNQIVIDESDIPPKIIDGLLPSHSMGKSLVSYVTGHAICKGYISSVDERLTDWNLLKNTLYQDQVLIDLLNMAAGDQKYIGERVFPMVDNMWKESGVNLNMTSLETIVESNLLNTQKSEPVYNYSALTTHVVMNYVIYKAGDDWKKLLHKVFNENAKVKNSVYFELTRKASYGHEPTVRYSFFATRYDYLRIAKAIMEDWNNDTCVGKYLKTLYDRRIDKNDNDNPKPDDIATYSKRYGGQFYFDIIGMENREIIGLTGFAGQNILIDLDNEKIVLVNSKYKNYDWEEIVYERIKNVQPHSESTKDK